MTKKCSTCKEEKPTEEFGDGPHRRYRCRDCERAYHRQYREKNRIKFRPYNRNRSHVRRLKNEFGLSPAQYEELCTSQNGKCPLCARTSEQNFKGIRLAVDHARIDGRIRGALCKRCNLGLGYFEDDPARLIRAAQYLLSHQWRSITAEECA